MPVLLEIGQGTIQRTSDTKSKSSSYLPPWKQATLPLIFKNKPVRGKSVTLVPVDVEVAPLQVKVLKAIWGEDPCQPKAPPIWDVEVESIKDPKVFEIGPQPGRSGEYPFDVVYLYPAVPAARQIKPAELAPEMLPKGIDLPTIWAAIDLTNDGRPDVVITKFCCGDPQKSLAECDYTCGRTFKKVGESWKLVDSSGPC